MYEHFHEAKHLKIWGEAITVSTGKMEKWEAENFYDFLQLCKKLCRGLLLYVKLYYRLHDRNKRHQVAASYVLQQARS